MNPKKPKQIILDSSVIAKWFFPSEKYSQIALKIEELFVSNDILISVPTVIYYEISNLLATSVRSLRISKKEARISFKGFIALSFIVYSSAELFELTLEKALVMGITSYDASYVALAEYLQIPLYTADQKLLGKVKSNLVKDLKEFAF